MNSFIEQHKCESPEVPDRGKFDPFQGNLQHVHPATSYQVLPFTLVVQMPSRLQTISMRRQPLDRAYLVWKIFWTMPRGTASAISARAACSPLVRRHPSAPRLPSACCKFFAPGIGIVSWQIHQLIATCIKQKFRLDVQSHTTYTLLMYSPYNVGLM